MGIIREVVDKGLIIQFDEEMVYMNRNKLNHLLLGYAISCHKSQGSTIDYSINIVTNAHKNMLSRGLLYVATTRCRKSHIDIGDESAFQYALSVCDNDLRKTWLLDLMTEEK
jgi:exodeoxyribonuclease V alpha subunit